MSTKLGGGDDAKTTQRKLRRVITSPCDRPPESPTGVRLDFTAIEALNHLRFRGKVLWNDVTTDTSGLTINTVDRWDIQWRATDAAGVPIETADGKVIHRTKRRDPVSRINIASAKNVGSRDEVQGVNLTNFGGADEVQSVSLTGFGEGDSFRITWEDLTGGGSQRVQRVNLTGFGGTDSFKLTNGGAQSNIITRGTNYTTAGIKTRIEGISGFTGTVTVYELTDDGFTISFDAEGSHTPFTVTSPSGCTGAVTTLHESAQIVRGKNYNGAHVKNIIENIPGFVGTVEISSLTPNGFTVTFGGRYRTENVAQLRVTHSSGCDGSVSTGTTGTGSADSFTLQWGGQTSAPIIHGTNYTREHIKNIIENITGFTGTVEISGAGTFDDTGFTITYLGTYARTNVAQIAITNTVGCSGSTHTDTAGTPGTTTLRYTTRGTHGFFTGDHVRITGCTPAAYNGTFTVTDSTGDTFDVTNGSGVQDLVTSGIVHDNDDSLHIPIPDFPRPRTWYWQARVRARSGAGCWSRWCAWTAPKLPWTEGTDPRPPAPTFDAAPITFDKVGQDKHVKFRLLFTFDEVTDWDVPGGDKEPDVEGYDVELDNSEDGTTWHGWPYRKLYATSKDADSTDGTDTPATRTVHFIGIRRWTWYRCRVRTVDRFGRKGNWSAWSTGALPFDNNKPPRPLQVQLHAAHDRIVVRWDAPTQNIPTRGTVTGASAGTTLTGTGTRFTDEVEAGALILVGGETRLVKKVTSNTALTVTAFWGSTHTAVPLYVIEDHHDIAYYTVQLGTQAAVDATTTPDDWTSVYDVHKGPATHHEFRIPDADEDVFFGARVRSVDAGLNVSRWIPARKYPNDDPDADGEYDKLLRDRTIVDFSGSSPATVGFMSHMWRADRDYRIKRITATVGSHDPATHPVDGTPSGSSIKINVRRWESDFSSSVSVLSGSGDDLLDIDINSHRDSATGVDTDFAYPNIDNGQFYQPKVLQVGSGRPGGGLRVSIVLVPR